MALWTFAEITTALLLDASDAATRTMGTGVRYWADQKGNGLIAAQETAANQPTVLSAALNGLDVLNLDGTDYMITQNVFNAASDVTVFCVFAGDTIDADGQAVMSLSNGLDTSNGYFHLVTRNNITNYLRSLFSTDSNSAGMTIQYPPAAFTVNNYMVSCSVRTATKAGFGVHGGYVEAAATGQCNFSNAKAIVGGYATTTYLLDGKIAQLVVLPYAVTTELRQIIEGHLHWKWGLQANLPADHPYKSAAPTIPDSTTIVRTMVQPYQMEGTLCVLAEQPYYLLAPYLAKLEQIYGMQLLALLAQHYGDVPVRMAKLDQYWGSAAVLRRICRQDYGDALRLCQGLDQEWGLNAGLLAIMEQRYSVAGDRYLAMAEHAYNINEYNLLRRSLEQISVIAADSALVQRPVISVTADGEPLDVSHVSIEVDEANLAITGEIHPADQVGFLRCRHLETVITVTIDADVYTLIVEAPRSSRPEVGQEQWIVPLASPTIKLDAPYALPLTREFAGAMASGVVAELAALEGITVVWSLIDWYLPAGTIYANAETPLAVIRKIVAAVGGVLQSSPAGDLICRPEYPLSPPAWASATPSHYLTDMDNFFSVDATPEIRDGWNRYLVADQDAAGDIGLSLESIDIDEHRKEVRVYQVPYNPAAAIALRTSGGSWVGIVAEGVTVETLTEQVEIVAGEGNVAKPLTTKISHDYRETVLGTITAAEDGHLRTEIDGNSLVEIVYTTTYRRFIVSDPNIEDVQFFPEEVAA